MTSVSDHITPRVNLIKARLDHIKIGDSETLVEIQIGKPLEKNITRTATTKFEHWVYTGEQMVNNLQGEQAAYDYAFYAKTFSRDFEISLYFENGILAKTQGF